MATVIVSLIIGILIVIIVAGEIKKRKSGKYSCSCGCSGCALKDKCHNKE